MAETRCISFGLVVLGSDCFFVVGFVILEWKMGEGHIQTILSHRRFSMERCSLRKLYRSFYVVIMMCLQ